MALFDVWGGVKAGNALFNDSIAQMGKFAADRALREKYGVTAGDPDLAAKLETNAFNVQNNPLLLQNNTLANAAKQQSIDFNTQNNPLVLQNNQLANAAQQQTNAFNLQNDPLRIKQQELVNQGAGITNQAAQATLDSGMQARRAQQVQSVMGTVLPALQTRLAGETDPVARVNIFNDAVRQIAPTLGMTPDQAVQMAASDAQLIAEHGADAVPMLAQRLSAARFSSLTPTQAVEVAKKQAEARAAEAKVGQAQAAAKASEASATLSSAKTAKELQDTQAGSLKLVDEARAARTSAAAQAAPIQRLEQLITGYDLADGTHVPSEIDRAIAAVEAMPDNTLVRTGQVYVPGTAPYVAEKYMQTIRDQLGLADIQALKNAGTAMGRVTNMELEAASNAYATLDTRGLSKASLLQSLKRIKEQAAPAFIGALRDTQAGFSNQAETIEGVLRQRGFGPQPSQQQSAASATPGPAQQAGASPTFFSSVAQAESGADGIKAANPRSTAVGTYQFTLPTWGALMKRHPNAGLTATGRTNPAQQQTAMTLLTQDNAASLRAENIPVNDGTLYAAHFTGAPTAAKLYQTPLSVPLSVALGKQSKDVMRANPNLKGMTVGDFWAFVDGKMQQPLQTATAGGITPASAPGPQFSAPAGAAVTTSGFIAPAASLAEAGRILGLQ